MMRLTMRDVNDTSLIVNTASMTAAAMWATTPGEKGDA